VRLTVLRSRFAVLRSRFAVYAFAAPISPIGPIGPIRSAAAWFSSPNHSPPAAAIKDSGSTELAEVLSAIVYALRCYPLKVGLASEARFTRSTSAKAEERRRELKLRNREQ
jgi:hypothetical protein